jgi:hypothetical protein
VRNYQKMLVKRNYTFSALSISIWIMCLLIAGCSTSTPSKPNYQDAKANVRSMCESILSSPEMAPVIKKVSPIGGQWSPLQLADRTKPTASERNALSAYFDGVTACYKLQDRLFDEYGWTKIARSARRDYKNSVTLAGASLYAGDITYGEYCQIKMAAWDKQQDEIDKAANEARRAAQSAKQNKTKSEPSSSSSTKQRPFLTGQVPGPGPMTQCIYSDGSTHNSGGGARCPSHN